MIGEGMGIETGLEQSDDSRMSKAHHPQMGITVLSDFAANQLMKSAGLDELVNELEMKKFVKSDGYSNPGKSLDRGTSVKNRKTGKVGKIMHAVAEPLREPIAVDFGSSTEICTMSDLEIL